MNQLFRQGIAPSTWHVYKGGFSHYQHFCLMSNQQLFPVSEEKLLYLVTHLSRTLAYGTIKSYLCGIQFTSITYGYPCLIQNMQRLYYLMRGVRRFQGGTFHRSKRIPITTTNCHQLLSYLRLLPICVHDKLMLWSAITVAFFGLLRSAEFTSPFVSRFNQSTLLLSDIVFSPDRSYIKIHLRCSKTDPFKAGCDVRVGATGDTLCPVSALSHFIHYRQSIVGPLFMYKDGSFLTRSRLASLLQKCFPLHHVNTHSLRIGGASTMASAGIPDSQIMILGRWSSNAYQRYLRLSDNIIRQSAVIMAKTQLTNKYWDPDVLVSKPICSSIRQ